MRRYRFTRQLRIAAPPGPVFDALVDTGAWPSWWPALAEVETLRPGDPLERVERFVVHAPLGYRLRIVGRFTALERPSVLVASLDGDLVGRGRMRLHGPGPTTVDYAIDVRVTARWMNALAPVLDPVFRRSHDRVVDAAFAGLQARLDADGDPGVGGPSR